MTVDCRIRFGGRRGLGSPPPGLRIAPGICPAFGGKNKMMTCWLQKEFMQSFRCPSCLAETGFKSRRPKKFWNRTAITGLAILASAVFTLPRLQAGTETIVGAVRVQLLSGSLVRLEVRGAEGFEDRATFHIKNRNWPGVPFTTNVTSGEVRVGTPQYVVHVPQNAASLSGTYVTTPAGRILYQFDGTMTNSVWLPGPADNPTVLSFADTPRLIPPAWGLTPAPAGAPLAATSGWDTNNDAADVYVLVPNGSYRQLRADFLALTGPTEMIPLYALGAWDSRWYDYSEATALAQIDSYRARSIPLDMLVCDTGWRQGASTGYLPNTSLFPNLPRFFSEAHARNVRVMFNDHPEPVAATALDPAEVTFRYTNLTQILAEGLDIWWYDRNWSVVLLSPAANLRHEVWGMRIYHDATWSTNAALRPAIMANVDGIDNGIRNRPMDVSAHTYPLQWTGDIQPATTYLGYAIQNAVHSGVQSLFPYESDDLGGHVADPSPGDYIRWIEYGALSPIFRPHCTLNLSRMPWTFGPEAEWTARRLINLRYRLLPTFYAAARENYDTGEPLLRRLDLDYPQYSPASQEGQYLIGHSLLVAPVARGGLAAVPSAWLTASNGQAGLDAAYFSNTNLTGAPALTRVDSNIDFNWNSGSPIGSVPGTDFTVRWTGTITVPASVGDVTLAALSDDGVRVWVDGQLCMGNWEPNDSITTESGTILKAGQTHQLRVEYLQLGGNDIVTLEWRGATTPASSWVPPGNWISAWTGTVLKGPVTAGGNIPLEEIPLYIRSGSIFALAPPMQYTGQIPWDPITLDVYPSTTEADQTALYEDDTLTTSYQQGQFRTTSLTTSADDSAKTVSVVLGAATGSYSGAKTNRSWVLRVHRPPDWSPDLAPAQVTLNGQPIGPIVRRIRNVSAMPLGADNGAPDADVFEVALPESSVLASNVVQFVFGSSPSSWTCGDVGDTGANGNVVEGSSSVSNSTWTVRGGGTGIGGTNDGFHFLYQPCVGNAQLNVRLASQQSTGGHGQAGIMMAEGLDPSAREVMIGLTPDNHLVLQNRSVGGGAAQITQVTGFSAPCWLRLVRNGTNFIGSASGDNMTWTQIGSVAIAGFDFHANLGLAVTADISASSPGGTNASGVPIVGVTSEMSGGVYSVDDPNYNLAIFDNVTLNPAVSISTVPNQTTGQSTATAAIPFAVSSTAGAPLTISADSSDTNIVAAKNIVIAGAGTNYSITLTPSPGATGTTTVSLTATDGTNGATMQFTLTVLLLTTLPIGGVLLNETFSNYPASDLPGQPFRGTGFSAGRSWSGVDSTYLNSVVDAASVSFPALTTPLIGSSGGKVTVKGDGSSLEALPDLSPGGAFATAGLYDPASGLIGGGNVGGTLYLSFLLRAHFLTGNGSYGGLQLSQGDGSTGVMIGNSLPAWAFSLWYPPTGASVDLLNNGGNYLFVDTNTHLMVVRISYVPGQSAALTAWLDPDPASGEANQNSASTYVGTLSGDLGFNRFFLSGGPANQWDYGQITFGTTWNSVAPATVPITLSAPAIANVVRRSDSGFGLTLNGSPGQAYSVLATTNVALPLASWVRIGGGTFGFDQATLTDMTATNLSQRFYVVTMP
jgi:hypothetical protein